MHTLILLLTSFAISLSVLAQEPKLVPLDKLKPDLPRESLAGAEQPQIASLGGNALFSLKDTEALVSAAEAAVSKDPTNPELLLKLGRTQDSIWRFRDATETYSSGIEKFPKDFRFYRMRGQRYISTRQFPKAIDDLQKVAKYAPGSFEAAYYLGLAYYFNGDHEKAASELARCEAQMKTPLTGAATGTQLEGRTCESMREDKNRLIPVQYWRYLALRRAGLMSEAKKYLDVEVSPLLEIKGTTAFYDALLFFKGIKEINEMLAGANEGSRDYLTRASATATFLFTEGERAKACGIWRRDVMDPNWDHLGLINAESEYFVNSKAACALYAAPPTQVGK